MRKDVAESTSGTGRGLGRGSGPGFSLGGAARAAGAGEDGADVECAVSPIAVFGGRAGHQTTTLTVTPVGLGVGDGRGEQRRGLRTQARVVQAAIGRRVGAMKGAGVRSARVAARPRHPRLADKRAVAARVGGGGSSGNADDGAVAEDAAVGGGRR